MEVKKSYIIGVLIALIIVVLDLVFLRNNKIFYFVLGLGLIIGILPFVIVVITENKEKKENDRMFLEFSRDLVENVKAGTPISKSIINVRNKSYGSLSPHVKKLANQISIGIPVREALSILSRDVKSNVVSRAVDLISEAERAGGDIERILESVSESIEETEKLKKERKASVNSLVVQGYIVFFIFVIIMLIMQFKILPMTEQMEKIGSEQSIEGIGIGGSTTQADFTKPLLFVLITQGLFAGIVIGKLSGGSIKAGIKHSFALLTISMIIYTGAIALL